MNGEERKSSARSALHIWSDAKRMVALRRQLLATEIQSDLAKAKRFGVLAAFACTLCLLGLFTLIVLLAGLLDGWIDRSRVPWATTSLGVLTLLIGGALLLSAWKSFRHRFHCLRESRAEIQEDLLWMREWIDGQLTEAAQENRD